MNDLIKRLRAWKAQYRGDGDERTIPLAAEAADRLTAMKAAGDGLADIANDLVIHIPMGWETDVLEQPYNAAIKQWEETSDGL